MQSVLILGGGIGGIVAANVLKSALGKCIDVAVIDRQDQHHYAPSFPQLLIGERRPQAITRSLKRLERKGVTVIRAEVRALDLAARRVATD